MNKPLLFYLCCLTALSSCRNMGSPSKKVTLQEDTTVTSGEIPAKAVVSDLDTSMIALKTFQTLSLENAIRQVAVHNVSESAHRLGHCP